MGHKCVAGPLAPPDLVQPVTVITPAGAADDSDAILFHSFYGSWRLLWNVNIPQLTVGIYTLSLSTLRICAEFPRTCYTRSRVFIEVS